MSSTPTRKVALTNEFEGDIKVQVVHGHGANASEVVRAGLSLPIEREHTVPRSRRVPSSQNEDAQ